MLTAHRPRSADTAEVTETVVLPGAAESDPADHRLRDVLPAGAAVLLLFGLLMTGAFLLRDVVDLGLWLVSSR